MRTVVRGITYKCAWCGKRFLPDTVVHRYCSKPCSKAGQKAEHGNWRVRAEIEAARRLQARQEVVQLCDAIQARLLRVP